MSFTLMVVLNATMVALLFGGLTYVMYIPFRLDKSHRSPHLFTNVLRETPDVIEAPPIPALY